MKVIFTAYKPRYQAWIQVTLEKWKTLPEQAIEMLQNMKQKEKMKFIAITIFFLLQLESKESFEAIGGYLIIQIFNFFYKYPFFCMYNKMVSNDT